MHRELDARAAQRRGAARALRPRPPRRARHGDRHLASPTGEPRRARRHLAHPRRAWPRAPSGPSTRRSSSRPRTTATGSACAWRPDLVFPGLRPGEQLAPRRSACRRARRSWPATARCSPGAPTAPPRTRPLAASVVGALGPDPARARRGRCERPGVPDRRRTSALSGLERTFDDAPARHARAASLLRRRRACWPAAAPSRATPVRTTISPRVAARRRRPRSAGRLGGVVALRPADRRDARLRRASPFSGLQPPGLDVQDRHASPARSRRAIATPATAYPVQTAATLEGVKLAERQRRVLRRHARRSPSPSPATPSSRRSARARRAGGSSRPRERFGFNQPPGVPGAATSTIPPADEIGDDLAVGSTAIGQGRVQATTLQMAIVAATIGLRGRRARA